MPLIQIEQDSPELIALVRSQINEMTERMRKHPSQIVNEVAQEMVYGYLVALLQLNLVSDGRWQELADEMRAAAKAARGGAPHCA